MENITTSLEKQVQLLRRIETFFELQACKPDIVADMNDLNRQCLDTTGALNKAKFALDKFRNELGPKYVDVMRKMQRNQTLAIHLMGQLKDNDRKKPILQEHNGQTDSIGSAKKVTADKMFLSDYQKSPFVTKMKPRCLSFLDFNFKITHEEFDQIPKYMRGRENLDELLAFMQTVIVPSFEEKYTLLYKNKKAVTNQQDLALWKIFNQQQSAFPNIKFVTQGDIARKMGRLIDKKVNVKLQMLRHLHVLQETRNEGTVYYLWCRDC
ncbi:AAEL009611-PA [Aedes aegypti]|uniref:SKA complex subunit 1 n=2 Tax=Aedes aegypti TaxID=7159 RepID=Q16VC1_AEDAE|nr:spindle and kinetochore-associated protein 1 [Aedes aegypti]XP_021698797.1 spindle and kinetochore-associated protein 1 [Aedes aegypti]EAT38512.1 AAEL009611-PA [Aedes aegypti]